MPFRQDFFTPLTEKDLALAPAEIWGEAAHICYRAVIVKCPKAIDQLSTGLATQMTVASAEYLISMCKRGNRYACREMVRWMAVHLGASPNSDVG